ncbi:MAG TPA: FHA domain-containing protein [Pseudomonadales bacterium]|nr:FHA domain-containing protein [Pseudomonadales bacterium]
MTENKEDPRAVPADQRSQGPNETMMISSAELASKVASAATGERRVIQGTPKLVGRSEAVAGVVVELTKPKTTVGRAEASDIVIEDGTVSSRHAQIVNENGVWRVVNLISTNGTSVNGNTAIVSYLAPGDIISFGRVEMLFEVPGADAGRAAAPKATRKPAGGGGRVNPMIWAGIGASVLVIVGVAAYLLLMR